MKKYESIGESLYEFKLPGGLRIYVLPKAGFNKSYALFATNFGSVNNNFVAGGERTGVPDGTAHFLEHKLFEEQEGNVFERFSALGASANAYTSFDMTGYLFSATKNFYEALEVLIKFVQNPYFTDENVEKEQGIIGQEINMYRDEPGWCCLFNLLRCMYKNHPVKIDIAGSIESISEINKDFLYKCYNAFYSPSNMVLFAAGDIVPEKVLETVEKCAKNSEPAEFIADEVTEPDEICTREFSQTLSVSKPMFELGFKERPSEDILKSEGAYSVLTSLIFGKSSPLYQRLYDEGLINASFSAGYTAGGGYAFVEVGGESDNPWKVRDIIFEYIEELRKKGVSAEDFERVKRSTYGKVVRIFNDVEAVASNFVSMLFRGGDFIKLPETIQKLTLRDINSLLNEALSNDRAALSVIMPAGTENKEEMKS